MGTFFLICLLVFLYVAIIRPIWRARQAMRDLQRRYRQAFEAAQQRTPPPRQPATPPRRRKKIDADVGEYVAFEEVTVTTATTDGDNTHYTTVTEQQIVDVEWEDLPPRP